MAEIKLTQAEADALIAMEKHRTDEDRHTYPEPGRTLAIPLVSADGREAFWLDIYHGRADLSKVTYQNRARQVVVLVRLDLGSRPHRNPDGEEIPSPHLHVYREGHGHKWAKPVPPGCFADLTDTQAALRSFLAYCHITKPPYFSIERGLFE